MNAAPDAMPSQVDSSFVEGLQNRLVRQFRVQVADWQDTCRALAKWEDRHLVESSSPARHSEHAAMLGELERVGQWLADAGANFDDRETATQIRLTMEDLHDSRAMWHGQVPEARRREILRHCFNES